MSYKMHQFRFRLGRWESLQRSTRPPSCIKGALLVRGKERSSWERKGRGRRKEGKGEGGEGEEEGEGVAQGVAHARAGSGNTIR